MLIILANMIPMVNTMEKTQNIKIVTLNVGSLNLRIDVIRDWMEGHQYDIIAIQETHMSKEDELLIKTNFKEYDVYMQHMSKANAIANKMYKTALGLVRDQNISLHQALALTGDLNKT